MLLKSKVPLIFLIVFCIFFSCNSTKKNTTVSNTNASTVEKQSNNKQTSGFLESLLKTRPEYFDDILKNHNELNVQIIYTQINRSEKGEVNLTPYFFNVNTDNYFYPASTVKLPIVLLALQKLQQLKDKGVDMNTAMITEPAFREQTTVYNDASSIDGKPTIAQYIKKILVVSDNDAYNRLYEFLGQDYINTEMKKKGYASVQILHRLNIYLTEQENRRTNIIKFLGADSSVLYEQSAQVNTVKYPVRKDLLGKGYYSGGKLINEAMDFSKKNRIGLQDLNKVMISLVFPDKVKPSERFNISESDRQYVLKCMSQYPTESLYPPYAADTVNYWPAYGKFLLFGSDKGMLPANIRIFNKEGDAYGHMLDVAYVVDFKNKIEFFLSAVIYCNNDGVLNDDRYDYDKVGFPFMKNLGKLLYDYELAREHKVKPDLSSLLFEYDK